jgi:hypothetical protein
MSKERTSFAQINEIAFATVGNHGRDCRALRRILVEVNSEIAPVYQWLPK